MDDPESQQAPQAPEVSEALDAPDHGLDAQVKSDPHTLRRVLASTGAAAYTAALKANVDGRLGDIVNASREAGHGIFMDTLPLVYGGRMSARDLVAISHGFESTSHSCPIIERMVEAHGIRGAIDASSNLVGLELEEEALEPFTTERILELLEAPLLKIGLEMDEARLLFGGDYVQREEVEHEVVRHTWDYEGRGMRQDVVLELRFEAGVLVGWKDERGKGRAILGGNPRLEANAEIPHYVGGFHLASIATCIAFMERQGVTEAEIDAFIDEATAEIRTVTFTWPSPELATLTAIGDRYVHDRLRTDEAPDRLDHYADRFANYDPASRLVPNDEFVAAALRVLSRIGGLEKVSHVHPAIYWVALTLLIVTSLGFLVFRAQLDAADAWPNLPPPDDAASSSDASSP